MSADTAWPSTYRANRAFFNFLGVTFRIFVGGKLAFFVKQRAFKLKEDIVVFADAAQRQPRLRIRARAILDFSATYDITDTSTDQRVGAFQRKGIRSLLRDTWHILDVQDQVIGTIVEDTGLLALLRRFLPIIPQSFVVRIGDEVVGSIQQRFNIFQLVYDVRTQATDNNGLDPRLGVAMSVLLLAIEGRQR